jgi:hypothetical protein
MPKPIEISIGAAFAGSFSKTVTGAQSRLQQLGSTMSRIGNTHAGISQLQNLGASANQLGRAYGAAKQRAEQLRAALAGMESSTKAQIRELERADAATEKARLALERQREALRSLKDELQAAGVNTKSLTSESVRLGNRTHPYTEKVIQPHKGFDIEEGHRIAALIEHKQGWASQSKARYRVDGKGDIVRNQKFTLWREAIKPDLKPKGKAEDFESATDEKSAQRIAQERGHTIIQTANSWKELHEKLAAISLRFEKKGSGAIVFVGATAVKASSIDRNFGLSKLCKRLGEFEAGEYPEEKPKIEPEPVSQVCVEEWLEYRRECREEDESHSLARKQAADAIQRTQARHREQRAAANAALAPRGLHILNIARHFIKEQQQADLAQLRTDNPLPKRRPVKRFKTWLAQRSKRLAGLWKFRKRITPEMEVRQFEFPKTGNLASPYRAYRALFQKRMEGEHMDDSRLDAMIALRMRLSA